MVLILPLLDLYLIIGIVHIFMLRPAQNAILRVAFLWVLGYIIWTINTKLVIRK